MPRLPKSAVSRLPPSLQILLSGAENPKPSKYRNTWTEVDGIRFQSKREADRYATLKVLEKVGKISDLRLQVDFKIEVMGAHICTYRADFVYEENGKQVVEDAKGMRTQVYKLKKELMRAALGIDVIEV